VRAVARYGAGVDTIDVEAARARDVAVVCAPSYAVSEVSDHAVALVLALTRAVTRLDHAVRAGTWDFRVASDIRRSGAMVVGVVGLGRIGCATASKLAAVGFEVIGHDPVARPEGIKAMELDELLGASDVVTLHLPLTPGTRHLLDAAAFARMQPGSYLVNTARGPVVDESALIDALRSGRLAGAALDVLEQEPPRADHPLLDLPNVILTPHAAYYSRESLVELKTTVAQGLVDAIGQEQS
jgi:D-3-phosphoglycerate dehydrogenase / 2-oxoglutarate reductase